MEIVATQQRKWISKSLSAELVKTLLETPKQFRLHFRQGTSRNFPSCTLPQNTLLRIYLSAQFHFKFEGWRPRTVPNMKC